MTRRRRLNSGSVTTRHKTKARSGAIPRPQGAIGCDGCDARRPSRAVYVVGDYVWLQRVTGIRQTGEVTDWLTGGKGVLPTPQHGHARAGGACWAGSPPAHGIPVYGRGVRVQAARNPWQCEVGCPHFLSGWWTPGGWPHPVVRARRGEAGGLGMPRVVGRVGLAGGGAGGG